MNFVEFYILVRFRFDGLRVVLTTDQLLGDKFDNSTSRYKRDSQCFLIPHANLGVGNYLASRLRRVFYNSRSKKGSHDQNRKGAFRSKETAYKPGEVSDGIVARALCRRLSDSLERSIIVGLAVRESPVTICVICIY